MTRGAHKSSAPQCPFAFHRTLHAFLGPYSDKTGDYIGQAQEARVKLIYKQAFLVRRDQEESSTGAGSSKKKFLLGLEHEEAQDNGPLGSKESSRRIYLASLCAS